MVNQRDRQGNLNRHQKDNETKTRKKNILSVSDV